VHMSRRGVVVTLLTVAVSICVLDEAAHAGVEDVVEALLERQEKLPERAFNLNQCMALALDYNKDILEAFSLVIQTGEAETIITRSRLFPQIEYFYRFNRFEDSNPLAPIPDQSHDESLITISQRVLEIGAEPAEEVSLRAAQRAALFGLENTVRKVLSDVRRSFYIILLKDEQIEIRKNLLKDWQDDLRKKEIRWKERETERSIDYFDVLQAELNVLIEQQNLSDLERERARLVLDLLQLMGYGLQFNITLQGESDDAIFDKKEAVAIGLGNASTIALLEEEVEEQKRILRETIWEFAPDVSFQAGVANEQDRFTVEVENSGTNTWTLGVSEELLFSRDETLPGLGQPDEDLFVTGEVRVPILEGARRYGLWKRRREELKQAEISLKREREAVEVAVRKSYEALLQTAENVRISKRSADVAFERFRIVNIRKEEIPALVSDQVFETFRNAYYTEQSRYFRSQEQFVQAQEELRRQMGEFGIGGTTGERVAETRVGNNQPDEGLQ